MIATRFIESTTTEVDAVLARVRMQAETLAALSPGDRLDIEAQAGSALLVQLVAEGQTIALASVEVVDGQLIATIINSELNNGSGLAGRRINQWKHRTPKTTD
jgi:flagellar motor switch/type III secretory pathway protein FliN